MKVWLNGELVEKEDAKLTVYDHGTLYGDGVFEGIRVYNGRIFQCKAHVDRLFASAKVIRLAIPYTKGQIIDAMGATLDANDRDGGYIRLVVTRGAGALGISPFSCPTPNVFIITDDIMLYSKEMYEHGIEVIIAKTVRISASMLNPAIKSLNYLNNIMAKIEAVDAGVPEAIMLNADGRVAECTADNIFIVTDGVVITPPPDAGMLLGITRNVVTRLAGTLGISLVEKDITPADLYGADECFLTGTAAEVIAVTRIDEHPVGTDGPGPVTCKLRDAFHEFINSGDS